ncbi:hypothetical protein CPC08DRAFT_766457 [Agrocybe pediades]|nr:hypothetical protein CPC08DRAFT_766457 [Agrocybe pediades]
MPYISLLSRRASSILIFIFHAVAIPSTVLRLLYRSKSKRLWWDDFWAGVALVGEIIMIVIYMVTLNGNIGKNPPPPGKRPKTWEVRRWLILVSYAVTLWTARLTVAVTIVRLLQQGRGRRVAKGVSFLFVFFLVGIILQKIAVCIPKPGGGGQWCSTPKVYGLSTGITELITDIAADVWLIGAPAYILLRMKMNRSHKRLIVAIFLCGIFTSLASISHVVFLFLNSSLWMGFTGHLQVAIAIVVSNLVVLVTYMYQAFRQRSRNELEDNSTGEEESTTLPTSQWQTESNYVPPDSRDLNPTMQTITTVELTELSHLGTTFEHSSNAPSTDTSFTSTNR